METNCEFSKYFQVSLFSLLIIVTSRHVCIYMCKVYYLLNDQSSVCVYIYIYRFHRPSITQKPLPKEAAAHRLRTIILV